MKAFMLRGASSMQSSPFRWEHALVRSASPVTLPKIPFFPHFPLWKREKLPFFRIFLQNWRKIFDKHVPPVI